MEDSEKVRKVGLAQRLLIWAVLASIVSWHYTITVLIAMPFQLYCVYRLAAALEMTTMRKVLYLVAMFIPCVSLICLLVINSKATDFLREHGVKVGLIIVFPVRLDRN